MIEDAAAAIIAGGRATRLGGVAKALLSVEGRPIVERQLDILGPLFSEILAVTSSPEPFLERGVRCVEDIVAGKGAPGGVHAALAAARAPWVFAVACDMPFLDPRPIEHLARLRKGRDAVAPMRAGKIEPLHAFFSRSCLAAFDARLKSSDPSLIELLRDVRTLEVPEDELRTVGPGLRFLENLNTPDDLSRVAARRCAR